MVAECGTTGNVAVTGVTMKASDDRRLAVAGGEGSGFSDKDGRGRGGKVPRDNTRLRLRAFRGASSVGRDSSVKFNH